MVVRRVDLALLDAAADLHVVDVNAACLADLGHSEGCGDRQVAGWADRWRRTAPDGHLPLFAGDRRPPGRHGSGGVCRVDGALRLATCRAAVVLRQLHNRYVSGDSLDERLADFVNHVPIVAERAQALFGG
jgi:hypothetical protein